MQPRLPPPSAELRTNLMRPLVMGMYTILQDHTEMLLSPTCWRYLPRNSQPNGPACTKGQLGQRKKLQPSKVQRSEGSARRWSVREEVSLGWTKAVVGNITHTVWEEQVVLMSSYWRRALLALLYCLSVVWRREAWDFLYSYLPFLFISWCQSLQIKVVTGQPRHSLYYIRRSNQLKPLTKTRFVQRVPWSFIALVFELRGTTLALTEILVMKTLYDIM